MEHSELSNGVMSRGRQRGARRALARRTARASAGLLRGRGHRRDLTARAATASSVQWADALSGCGTQSVADRAVGWCHDGDTGCVRTREVAWVGVIRLSAVIGLRGSRALARVLETWGSLRWLASARGVRAVSGGSRGRARAERDRRRGRGQRT